MRQLFCEKTFFVKKTVKPLACSMLANDTDLEAELSAIQDTCSSVLFDSTTRKALFPNWKCVDKSETMGKPGSVCVWGGDLKMLGTT